MKKTVLPLENKKISTELQLDIPDFTDSCGAIVHLLERRYLDSINLTEWEINIQGDSINAPIFQEISELGQPNQQGEWAKAMPHILSACCDPGHAMVSIIYGDGNQHHFLIGGRRIIGNAFQSTEDYLASQAGAFKSLVNGLKFTDRSSLNSINYEHLRNLLNNAPITSVVTGIPSGRGGVLPTDMQSIDHLISGIGTQRYAIITIAEPIQRADIDNVIDQCRDLKGEFHRLAQITKSMSESKGENESSSNLIESNSSQRELAMNSAFTLISALTFGASFLSLPAVAVGGLRYLGSVMPSIGQISRSFISNSKSNESFNKGSSTGTQASISQELLNAHAAAMEGMIQSYIDRLIIGKNIGWWQTGLYVVSEDETTHAGILSALRSILQGDQTHLDPIRQFRVPAEMIRDAVVHCKLLYLHPINGKKKHPFGSTFEIFGSCITSNELAVIINLPQKELPGIIFRNQAEFAVNAKQDPDVEEVLLGSILDKTEQEVGKITISLDEINRHCFISGTNGSGKTNTCKQLLSRVYEDHNIPFLVIEPVKTEYRKLINIPSLKNALHVYGMDIYAPLQLRLNPFTILPGVSLAKHIDLLKAVFNASFSMGAGMSYILEDAIIDIYTERGWNIHTSKNRFLDSRPRRLYEQQALTPCLSDLLKQVEIVAERKKYAGEIHQNLQAALKSRINSLTTGMKGIVLNSRRTTPLADIFTRPTVIELNALGDLEEKAFVMAILWMYLYEYAEARQDEQNRFEKLQHITLIEEAHQLLKAAPDHINPEIGDPTSKAVSMFTNMLAEMRAYGEGFIIADQNPRKLAAEILKNTNLKISHRLVYPDDRYVMGECMSLTERQIDALVNLRKGQAVVHTERLRSALLVKIPLHPIKATLIDLPITIVNHKRDELGYLYKHTGCRSCPSPCNFYLHIKDYDENLKYDLFPLFDHFVFNKSLSKDKLSVLWEKWMKWRDKIMLQIPDDINKPKLSNFKQGRIFCVAVSLAYEWVEKLLLSRQYAKKLGKVTVSNTNVKHVTTQSIQKILSPEDILNRETIMKDIGDWLWEWGMQNEFNEEVVSSFGKINKIFYELILQEPNKDLKELKDCQICPVKCRALGYIAPLSVSELNEIKTYAFPAMTKKTSVDFIDQTCIKLADKLQLKNNLTSFEYGLVYCAIVHYAQEKNKSSKDNQLEQGDIEMFLAEVRNKIERLNILS